MSVADVYRAMVTAPQPKAERPVSGGGLRATMFTRASCPNCHGCGTVFDQQMDGDVLRVRAALCECVSFGHRVFGDSTVARLID